MARLSLTPACPWDLAYLRLVRCSPVTVGASEEQGERNFPKPVLIHRPGPLAGLAE